MDAEQRDKLRGAAELASQLGHHVGLLPHEITELLDALDEAEERANSEWGGKVVRNPDDPIGQAMIRAWNEGVPRVEENPDP